MKWIAHLVYSDVDEAVVWLCETFGFIELWRAGGHRARVAFGNGVLIIADADPQYGRAVPQRGGRRSHAVMVKVETSTHTTSTRCSGERGF